MVAGLCMLLLVADGVGMGVEGEPVLGYHIIVCQTGVVPGRNHACPDVLKVLVLVKVGMHGSLQM